MGGRNQLKQFARLLHLFHMRKEIKPLAVCVQLTLVMKSERIVKLYSVTLINLLKRCLNIDLNNYILI